MKKLFTALFTLILLSFSGYAYAGSNVEMLAAVSQKPAEQNYLWVGTFQMVWNEFANNIVKGPIKFKFYKSQLANLLNKQEFTKAMLSEDSYYTVYGKTDLALKKQIEDAIMQKFNEKSDFLDKMNWTSPNRAYLLYAMLVKNFEFPVVYDVLAPEKFGSSNELIPYFGIDKRSSDRLYKNVKVLFYNNPWDYAVALGSDKDEVILYRTNSHKKFSDLYKNLNKKAEKYKGQKEFTAGDMLKVPFMSINQNTSYDVLCGKIIENTDRLYIDKALQTVNFNMSNSGVKLKSEAVMSIMTMSMPIMTAENGRNFFFNNTFVLFLKEKDKQLPYFAVRVKDMSMYKYNKKIR